ncbi:MAG: HAD-IA family hydrolase [Chloroflexi bacterium]|nr:HAD-IA family hydrolase [Chloroflexota bacterium]MBK6710732.1 HAD-IA family hydrolase [Chloroflexota bacterium]MBK7179697.1 HAD-IA family hydrolase [Chloroflexota bacterium]MBK7917348.1 HAD-IA family hydrolase [Chloroflexota bacterium]MBK8933135.1 HAD-IA family hydrolase [Chloroflexota bacterium]
MKLKALIFDVDGTIANTEYRGHLPACNEAFATLGYPIKWTWDEFVAMQAVPGNAQRMRLSLQAWNPQLSDQQLDEKVERLVELKKKFYIEKYLPDLPLRDGVLAIMQEALRRGVRLAVVSMSYEAQVNALLASRLPDIYAHLNPILGKESGPKTAPDSPLYKRCLAELGTKPEETLVIEDSQEGFEAAKRAGLPCAVMYNDYTFGKNFAGAQLVARSLAFFSLEQLQALCLP